MYAESYIARNKIDFEAAKQYFKNAGMKAYFEWSFN